MASLTRRNRRGNNSLRNALAKTASGTIAGQAVVILASPLLARYYSPSDFGEYGVFAAIVAITTTMTVLRLDVAMLAADDDETAANIAWVAIATSICTAFIMGVFVYWLTIYCDLPITNPILILGTLTVATLGLYLVSNAWMVRQQRYTALAVRSSVQGIAQTLTQLILGITSVRYGLLAGLAAGRLSGIGGLISVWGVLRQPRPSPALAWQTIKRYRRFPLVSSWSGLLNSAGLQAPMLLIAFSYGAVPAGLLALTSRVLAGPVALLGTATASVFQGEMSKRKRTAPHALTVRTLKALLIVGSLPTLAIILFARPVFTIVFGSEWTEAGDIARILAPAYLAQFAVVPISQTLLIFERNGTQFWWDAARLVLVTAGPVAAFAIGLSLQWAVLLLAIGQVLAYSGLAFLTLRITKGTFLEPALETTDHSL